ncbi:neurofilament heavy polypeptide isoform X2 [Halyomorpha halys]|uniref:neurofilament heavy polypeptide isoform X2 n=1 Tax=Halyomorpha halys TaxID=286706 RepID=UPI0006D4D558|nr:uncharacterized protein LOC106687889 isoform X2 [Halyomorpha halys]
MHSKAVATDKMVKKKLIKSASKIKVSMAESDKCKGLSKYKNNLTSKGCGTKLSSIEIRKHSACQISDSKTKLYKNMKKLLETKYKKITSVTSSREKLSPEKSRYDPKVYNLTTVKENALFSGNPLKKTSSMSDTNTVDSRYTLKEEKYLSNQESLPTDILGSKIDTNSQDCDVPKLNEIEERISTKDNSEEVTTTKKKSDEDPALSESKESKLNKNLTKGQEKTKKFKISKRLAFLARHKELPIPVKRDLAFKPFKVPKRALLFRATPRILELAKPVHKLPPVDILPAEEVFKVKKRSLKARCSKRISELAFPVMRPEEYRIKVEHPHGAKRRSLRAKCTKRVKELAKPLARRCRSPIRKPSNEDGLEG